MDVDGFRDRLRIAIGDKSIRGIAPLCDSTDGTLRRYLSGESTPTLDRIVPIAKATNTDVVWLAFGEGPMRPGRDHPDEEHAPGDWSVVPQYGDRLSAGAGSFIENGNNVEVVGSFAFKPKWLNRKCPSGKCAVFRVAGDSMFPIIQDGDVVLVDMSQNDPLMVRDGKIYAFSEGDFIKVKRLVRQGSELWAISDNKAVSPDCIIDMSIFSLIGRVIWIGHEVW